jgi:hypothetical protein
MLHHIPNQRRALPQKDTNVSSLLTEFPVDKPPQPRSQSAYDINTPLLRPISSTLFNSLIRGLLQEATISVDVWHVRKADACNMTEKKKQHKISPESQTPPSTDINLATLPPTSTNQPTNLPSHQATNPEPLHPSYPPLRTTTRTPQTATNDNHHFPTLAPFSPRLNHSNHVISR